MHRFSAYAQVRRRARSWMMRATKLEGPLLRAWDGVIILAYLIVNRLSFCPFQHAHATTYPILSYPFPLFPSPLYLKSSLYHLYPLLFPPYLLPSFSNRLSLIPSSISPLLPTLLLSPPSPFPFCSLPSTALPLKHPKHNHHHDCDADYGYTGPA